MHISSRSISSLLLALTLSACAKEAAPPPPDGEVIADESAIDLGTVFVGEPARSVVRVKNRGRKEGALELQVDPPFTARALDGPSLAPGAIAEVEITLVPGMAGPASGVLVASIPGVPGSATVALTGAGAARTLDIPEVLDVGAVEVGRSTHAELRVRNTAPLPQVLAITIDGADAAAFVPAARSLPLGSGQEATLGIEVAPASERPLVARLHVSACEACEERTVLLTGRAWTSSVAASPGTLDLGDVPPGGSLRGEVRVQNTSAGAVTVSSVQLVAGAGSPFAVELPQLPAQLAPGALPLPVTFAPERTGPFTASLRIVVAGTLLEVQLRGRGGSGNVLVSPASVDLGVVPTSVGGSATVTVTDTGAGSPPQVKAVMLEGPDAQRFNLRPRRELPADLRGDPLAIDVSVSTSEPGTFAATLVIDVEGKAARRVPLAATVVVGGWCDLQLDTSAIHFGLQPYGQTTERKLVVRNAASIECTAGPFTVQGSSAFSVGLDPGQTRLVPARGSITVPVRYTPVRGTGPDAATLEFRSTAQTSPEVSVPLTGRGSEPVLAATPSALEFPAGSRGAEDLLAVDLRNLSPVPLRLADQQVTGAGFSIAQPAGPDLPVGGQVTVHVRHTAGDRAVGELSIAIQGAAAPIVIPLSAPAATADCGAGCPTTRASCPGAIATFLQRDQAITGGASSTAGKPSCTWRVATAPQGSAAAAPAGGCASAFRADVAGLYELELTARGPDDRTATCTTRLDVTAAPGLWIETRGPENVVLDQHLFVESAGALDQASTWTAADGHAWRKRVRPSWGATGLDDDPIVEPSPPPGPSVIRVIAPEAGVDYEVGVHRPQGAPPTSVDAATVIWCAGQPVTTLQTTLPSPHDAAHLGTVRFAADGSCSFTPGTLLIEVQP